MRDRHSIGVDNDIAFFGVFVFVFAILTISFFFSGLRDPCMHLCMQSKLVARHAMQFVMCRYVSAASRPSRTCFSQSDRMTPGPRIGTKSVVPGQEPENLDSPHNRHKERTLGGNTL